MATVLDTKTQMKLLELTNPLVDLSAVTEVYALYTYPSVKGGPSAELVLIDPEQAYSVPDRIEILKEKGAGLVNLGRAVSGASLQRIYVLQVDKSQPCGNPVTPLNVGGFYQLKWVDPEDQDYGWDAGELCVVTETDRQTSYCVSIYDASVSSWLDNEQLSESSEVFAYNELTSEAKDAARKNVLQAKPEDTKNLAFEDLEQECQAYYHFNEHGSILGR